jgi:hypothetical protein
MTAEVATIGDVDRAVELGINVEEINGNSNINISNHAYERFAERIHGMIDPTERRRYINEHKERLAKEIQALWKYANYIWQGQLYNNISRKYWLRDNIVVVTDVDATNIVTLYKINYGWGDETDRMLAEKVMSEVSRQRYELEGIELSVQADIEKIDHEAEWLERNVKAHEELAASFRAQLAAKQEERKVVRSKTDSIRKELELNMHRICNSLEYSREVRGAENTNSNGGRR